VEPSVFPPLPEEILLMIRNFTVEGFTITKLDIGWNDLDGTSFGNPQSKIPHLQLSLQSKVQSKLNV